MIGLLAVSAGMLGMGWPGLEPPPPPLPTVSPTAQAWRDPDPYRLNNLVVRMKKRLRTPSPSATPTGR